MVAQKKRLLYAALSLSLEESNLHSQNQNLVHYHYAKGQSFPIEFGTAKIYII